MCTQAHPRCRPCVTATRHAPKKRRRSSAGKNIPLSTEVRASICSQNSTSPHAALCYATLYCLERRGSLIVLSSSENRIARKRARRARKNGESPITADTQHPAMKMASNPHVFPRLLTLPRAPKLDTRTESDTGSWSLLRNILRRRVANRPLASVDRIGWGALAYELNAAFPPLSPYSRSPLLSVHSSPQVLDIPAVLACAPGSPPSSLSSFMGNALAFVFVTCHGEGSRFCLVVLFSLKNSAYHV